MRTPLNDSGLEIENSFIDTDDEDQDTNDQATPNKTTNKAKYKKPKRPCLFCGELQSRYKRHILNKHEEHERVMPLLSMIPKQQDRFIDIFRREAIREYNMKILEEGSSSFMRERASATAGEDVPVMCSGCKGFFSRTYKSRHVCPIDEEIVMLPITSVTEMEVVDNLNLEFKGLLNTLHVDDVSNYIKQDEIILMIGSRAFNSLRRKRDKIVGSKKTVRAQMRLMARVYLSFRDTYSKQNTLKLKDSENNVSDMFRREVIQILGESISNMTELPIEGSDDFSVSSQKSGLKISILNLLKLSSKYLIGFYLMKNMDDKSKRVTDFVQVLKLFENEIFGDAYYDLNFRKNVNSRKPVNLPSDEDVKLLMNECVEIMGKISDYDFPDPALYTDIRTATLTYLIIFNARRGGEPGRLFFHQWKEALRGDWLEKDSLPDDFDPDEANLITFITGKGADHLVPIIFPVEVLQSMTYLTNMEVRRGAGVSEKNQYVFSSSRNSMGYASGWHAVNQILEKLDLKGSINATTNRHRVATILGKLQLTPQEKELVFKHFGHSKQMNENRYQAAGGSNQLAVTGKRLNEINLSGSKTSKEVGKTSQVSCCSSPSSERLNEINSSGSKTSNEAGKTSQVSCC